MIPLEHEKTYHALSGFRMRWCRIHNVFHGYLYDCPYFSDATRAIIHAEDLKKKAMIGMSIALVITFVSLLLLLR